MNEQLNIYIEKSRQAGNSDEQIKQNLMNAGWKESDVGDAFQEKPQKNVQQNNSLPNKKFNTLAIVAILLCIVLPPIAIILAIISLVQIKKRNEKGTILAIVALILSIGLTFLMILMFSSLLFVKNTFIESNNNIGNALESLESDRIRQLHSKMVDEEIVLESTSVTIEDYGEVLLMIHNINPTKIVYQIILDECKGINVDTCEGISIDLPPIAEVESQQYKDLIIKITNDNSISTTYMITLNVINSITKESNSLFLDIDIA